jgi:hypothetical protein
LQESPVANRIKEAFFSEKGLAGNVQRLPFDKLFSIDSVKKVRLNTQRGDAACAALRRSRVRLQDSSPLWSEQHQQCIGANTTLGAARPVLSC